MTRPEAGHFEPSTRFDLRAIGSDDKDYGAALALVLTGHRQEGNSVRRQIDELLFISHRQRLTIGPLLGAFQSSTLVCAVLAIESPGRTAMVYAPPADRSTEACAALVELLCDLKHRARQRKLAILQALVLPDDRGLSAAYASAGFNFLAELIYMDRSVQLESARKINSSLSLRAVSYHPWQRGLFLQALNESYMASLDCPGLAGLRQPEDILAGHAATGVYRDDGWFLALDGTGPVGLLLTSRVAIRSALEIVYIGVSPRARGQGVGDYLMGLALDRARREAVDDVTLAVDSINEPARRLYQNWMFAEKARRRAWIHAPSAEAS